MPAFLLCPSPAPSWRPDVEAAERGGSPGAGTAEQPVSRASSREGQPGMGEDSGLLPRTGRTVPTGATAGDPGLSAAGRTHGRGSGPQRVEGAEPFVTTVCPERHIRAVSLSGEGVLPGTKRQRGRGLTGGSWGSVSLSVTPQGKGVSTLEAEGDESRPTQLGQEEESL